LNRNAQHAYTAGDERLGLDFLLESNQHARSTGIGPTHAIPPTYSILPRTTAASCPLDAILLDFLAKNQRLAAEGVPGEELAGPAYPNFNVLLKPAAQHTAHPLSKFFMDIVHTFPDIVGLPEQVAVVYIMFLVMRWQVNPTKENYERLPEWVMPRPSQLFTPHPHWLDYLPW
jgi:hypothetical protein